MEPLTVIHTGSFTFNKKAYRYSASIDLSKCLERAATSGALDLDEPKAIGQAEVQASFTEM